MGTYPYIVAADDPTTGVYFNGTNPTVTVTWDNVNQQTAPCTPVWSTIVGDAPTVLHVTDVVSPGTTVSSVIVQNVGGPRDGSNTVYNTPPVPTTLDLPVSDQQGYNVFFVETPDRGEVDFCKFTPTAPGEYNFYYTVTGGGPLMKKVTPPGYFALAVAAPTAIGTDLADQHPTCADLIELPPGSSPATVTVIEFPRLGADLQRWELFDETNMIGGTPLNVKYGGQGLSSYYYRLSVSYPQRRMLRSWDQPAPLPAWLTAGGTQGCSPAYWGDPNHYAQWVGYNPTSVYFSSLVPPFNGVFPTSDPELTPWTLSQAVTLPSTYNNDVNALFAHDAVAALLNTTNPNVKYGISTTTVLNWASWAIGSKTLSIFNSIVEPLNSRPCPLP